MKNKWLLLLWALCAGSLLCIGEQFQPFRLRVLNISSFSPEFEWRLREWSEPFAAFCPAWLLHRAELEEAARGYPFSVEADWDILSSRLTLTPRPFMPDMKVQWRFSDYLVSKTGTAWRSELWEKSLSVPLPELPVLKVGNSFPLLTESGDGASFRLTVTFDWLYSILETLSDLKNVSVSETELLRRGGDDVVSCHLESQRTHRRIYFMSRADSLSKNLSVAQELLESKDTQTLYLDATYENKIIIKKIAAPQR